jgi:hypothetical protein
VADPKMRPVMTNGRKPQKGKLPCYFAACHFAERDFEPWLSGTAGLRVAQCDANVAVDGAHSTASVGQRVVALKRTTMRGAVHGRC